MKTALTLLVALSLFLPQPVQAEEQVGEGLQAQKGDANFALRKWGDDYLAMRLPRGTVVTICGAGGCWYNARTTDVGPVKATGDLADIAFVKFMKVCGYTAEEAQLMGECEVIIEWGGTKIVLPETDTEPTPTPTLFYWLEVVR